MRESSKHTSEKEINDREKQFSINNSDWTPARIKFELEERGFSLAKLSRNSGYSPSAAGRALRISWPAVEEVIAEAIGVKASEIWPSRYDGGISKAYAPRRQKRIVREE